MYKYSPRAKCKQITALTADQMFELIDVKSKLSKSFFDAKNVTTGRTMMRMQYENTVRNTSKSALLLTLDS